jgi:imidazole glycerol-phosphate synthase subunit HisH
MPEVAIVNYELGNLRSVENALEYLGAKAGIVSEPSRLSDCSHIILPGVGAFGEGMQNLKSAGWAETLCEHVKIQKKPFLGICLGMQLCAAKGTEHGLNEGLNFIGGTAERMPEDGHTVRIPHIGWNTLTPPAGSRMLAGLPEKPCFYFVHSYALTNPAPEFLIGHAHHGEPFIATAEHENIWCAQFHPEKSQKDGLRLLRNFIEMRD